MVRSFGNGQVYTVCTPSGSPAAHNANRADRHLRALTNENEPSLRVYSTGDGPDVYEDNFMKIAKPDGSTFHPTVILVSTRLGIDKITPVYWEALIAALQMPQSIGIAG